MRMRRYLFLLTGAYCLILHGANPDFTRRLDLCCSPSDMATDPDGNIYLTGTISGAGLATTPGAYKTTADGFCFGGSPGNIGGPGVSPCLNGFVTKLRPDGSVIWATYLGSQVFGIAVDGARNVYAVGSGTLPTTGGAAFEGASGLFVAKLNPSGSGLVYASRLPGLGYGTLALDAGGAAYVCGESLSDSAFPTTDGAIQSSPRNSSRSAAVAKLSPDGSRLIYATYLSGSGRDTCRAIAVDADGYAYVAGSTTSSDFPVTPAAFQTVNRWRPDSNSVQSPPWGTAFIAKLNPSGSAMIYSTLLGGTAEEIPRDLRVDRHGNAVVIGHTSSADFPVTERAFQTSGPGASWGPSTAGGFAAKVNPFGTGLVYSTYLNGATRLTLNAAGSAIIAGVATSAFPAAHGALATCYSGGKRDIYLARLDPQGHLAEATHLGGAGEDYATTLGLGLEATFYLAGGTDSTNFAGSPSAAGAFLSKLRIAGAGLGSAACAPATILHAATFSASPLAPGEIVSIMGSGLGPPQGVEARPDSDGLLPVALGETRVFFGGTPAPLLYVSDAQVNAVAPFEIGGQRSVTVRVERNGATVNHWIAPVIDAAPGIFVHPGSIEGAILNQDGTANSRSNPAEVGSVVSIFATGGGITSPVSATGSIISEPLRHTVLPVRVWMGSSEAQVEFAGAAPGLVAGVLQVNARVSEACAGAPNCGVDIGVGAYLSGVTVTIAVK